MPRYAETIAGAVFQAMALPAGKAGSGLKQAVKPHYKSNLYCDDEDRLLPTCLLYASSYCV
jgi:hypothetical protein